MQDKPAKLPLMNEWVPREQRLANLLMFLCQQNERLAKITGEPLHDRPAELRAYDADWLLYSIGFEQAELQRQIGFLERARRIK